MVIHIPIFMPKQMIPALILAVIKDIEVIDC